MAGLPKNLMRKYHGNLAKAWRVFRSRKGHSSTHSHSRPARHSRRARVTHMARRRHSFARRSSSRGGMSSGKLALYSFGYGFARQPISNIVRQVAGPIVGNVGDEVTLGVLGYFLARKGGMLGDAGKAMLTAEAYGLGRSMSQGGLNILGGLGGSSTTQIAAGSGATFA